MPTPRAPPGEKWSGERSLISWAYSPKRWKDQSDCEIDNYYVALPYNIKIYSSPFEYPYFFWVGFLQNILNVVRLHCR